MTRLTRNTKCSDCTAEGITTRRKMVGKNGKPFPAGRCYTHHKGVYSARRRASRNRRIESTYGLTEEEYQAIYDKQKAANEALGLPGICYICGHGNGKFKAMPVDHCHKTGVVRGILCSNCNKNVLGRLRDDVEALQRAINYLMRPPAIQVIGKRVVPNFEETAA